MVLKSFHQSREDGVSKAIQIMAVCPYPQFIKAALQTLSSYSLYLNASLLFSDHSPTAKNMSGTEVLRKIGLILCEGSDFQSLVYDSHLKACENIEILGSTP